MKSEWEVRAQSDYFRAVTGRLETDEFWKSGEQIVGQLVEPFLAGLEIDASNSSALDMGCGAGRVTLPLSKLFRSVIGVDVSPTMLDVAQDSAKGLENVSFMETDGTRLNGIDDDALDIACSFFVFHHMPTMDAISANLSELHRVVRPGGGFVIDTSYRRGGWWRTKQGNGFPVMPRQILWLLPWRFSNWLATKVKPVYTGTADTWFGAKPMSEKKLRNLFAEHGLIVDHVVPSISPRNVVLIGHNDG